MCCALVLAASINCATVALVDAGIEMYDLVIASSLVGILIRLYNHTLG